MSHRALEVADICDDISSRVDARDALSLLRTSRPFFHSAIRYVWGRQTVAAQDLLKLLAGFTYHWVNDLVHVGLCLNLP
jgi:hypothetical protein